MKSEKQAKSSNKILQLVPSQEVLPLTKVKISLQEKIKCLNIGSVLYFKSTGYFTEIYLKDGNKILSSNSFRSYANILSSDNFISVHPKYMINKSSLSCYLANQNKIVLHNSQEIPVSNNKKEGLLKYLESLTE